MMKCTLRKSGLAAVIIAALLVIAMTGTASAADTVSVDVTGTYGQTEARSMLSLVNDFRTGRITDGGQSTVWAYDSQGNIDTASYANLSELQYDYELEKVAKKRAMELILQFDHQRPDGQSCYSIFPNGYSAMGENIAAGYGDRTNTAQKAFKSWSETDYLYSGQGHRRNMLGRGYNRIGIAHVVVNYSGNLTEGDRDYPYTTQIHYWVQEFGYRNDTYGLAQTEADDSETTLPIDVLSSKIEHVGIETDADSFEMVYGDTQAFSGASSVIRLGETWPKEFKLSWPDGAVSKGPYYVTVGGGYTIDITDSSIASVSGKNITAKKAGTTAVTVTSDLDNSVSKSVSLTVKPVSIDDATATVSGSFTYDGTAKRPDVTVTKKGKTLTVNTDYTVAYEKNTEAGTAAANITGKGNYAGSCKANFEISPQQLAADMFTVDDSGLVYNGKAQSPEVTGRYGNNDLARGTDYTVTCDEAVNAGTYSLNITGQGNFAGSVSPAFVIHKAEYPPAVPDDAYTVPYLTKTLDNKILAAAEGWAFDSNDIGKSLNIGVNSFDAKYTGNGAGNYIHETKTIKITRKECLHPDSSVEIKNKVAPDCENDGYTGDRYCNDCKTVIENGNVDPAAGHAWGTVSYSWADDGSACTAARNCTRNGCNATDSEDGTITSDVTQQPTCDAKGKTTYTATFTKEGMATGTKEIEDVNPLGHAWGPASYSWADDNSTCTATRNCGREGCTGKDTETVNSTSEITTPPTDEAPGERTYTAVFQKDAFETQTKKESVSSADVIAADAAKKAADSAKTVADAAKQKADESKAAAEEAAKTPGQAAIDAAKKAQFDASAAKLAADAYKEAADAYAAAAEKAYGTDAQETKDAKQAASDAAAAAAAAAAAVTDAKNAASTAEKAKEDKEKADKAASDREAAGRAAAEREAADREAEAEARAQKVSTVTVNVATVNAKAVDNAVKKAGGSEKYVTKIILGGKVKKISSSAFSKYKKAGTLTVKTKKLKKASVKNSLKGSKITKVQVKIGSKKVNKQYVKKYKTIFTKKNAGRKARVS